MAYDTIERSVQDAQPVELYEFARGSVFYRYTSAREDFTFDGNTYTAATMQRSAIESSQEVARGALNIQVARTLPIVGLFNPLPPSDVVRLTLYRQHVGDTDFVVVWMGRVLNVAWAGLQATIRCESAYSSIKRPGLRRLYQRQCPHVLYSEKCGVDPDDFKVATTASVVSGLAVTAASLGGAPSGYFTGGYVEWAITGGALERRSIRSHVANVLTLNFPPTGLVNGASITVFPGCNHTIATCQAKFGNRLNYGGMPYIPRKNPFDGTPIY